MQTLRRHGPAILGVLALAFAAPRSVGQEQSMRPGINKPYENPNVPEFIQKFETESREIYARREQIVAACHLQRGMVVADIGAGTGLFTRLFAREVGATGKVYAVDIAPKFIAHIEKTCREQHLTNVVGVVCKQDSTDLPADSINLAFICDTYHHFEYPARTLASLHRALRRGGSLVLVDFKRIPGKTPEWIMKHVRAGQDVFTKEIETAGFRQVGEEKFLHENYLLRFEEVETPHP